MTILLETNRMILRRLTLADADSLFKLDNDPDVMRFINGGTPTPLDVFERDILPLFLMYDPELPGLGFFAAIEKERGEFLGWISLRLVENMQNQAVLGYRLCKDAWGRGFATEGASALINIGFAKLGLERITATTYQDNLGSIRVMEKVGMRLLRRYRMTQDELFQSDTHHVSSFELWDGDDVEYVIDRRVWADSSQTKQKYP